MSARPVPNRLRPRVPGSLRVLLVGAVAGSVLATPVLSSTAVAAAPLRLVASSTPTPAPEPTPTPSPTPTPTPAPDASDVTMVQANIYTGLTVEKFQKDVATVLSLQPDFVSYNEVPFRNDVVMAPEGYDIWRNMKNRFTAATPVAWRSDRWTPTAKGVFRISNWRGKPKGRVVEIGRRFANWVTLQDAEGRTVSVVSVHVAPLDKNMPDLLRRSVKRLAVLTARLAPAGPVLVGGDFNVHYKSGRYPRDLIEPTGLAPTFDTLGNFFPTGDHHGATIDYVFNRGAETIVADRHYAVELKSDHDAVVAGLSWLGDLESESVSVRSNPAGGAAERRSALKSLKVGINAVPAGGVVRLVTRRVDLYAVRARLVAAARRGAAVQVSIVGKPFSEVETKLQQQLVATGQADSWVRGCTGACARTWSNASPPRTLMLTGEAPSTWSVRFDVDRWLTSSVIKRSTSVTRSVGDHALEEAGDLVAGIS